MERPRLALIGCSEEVRRLIADGWGDGVEVVEESADGPHDSGEPVSVVVVGPDVERPLVAAQKASRSHEGSELIVAVRREERSAVSQGLLTTPNVGVTTACVPADDDGALRRELTGALHRVAARQRNDATIAQARRQLAGNGRQSSRPGQQAVAAQTPSGLFSGNSAAVLAGLMAMVILLFDLALPLGFAAGVAHVFVVLVAYRHPRQEAPVVAAICTSLLVLVGGLFSGTAVSPSVVVVGNRVLAVVMIWVTVLMLARYRRIERRAGEEGSAAAVARSRLAAIVEGSQDAIIGATLDGTVTSWNAGARKLYGYMPAEILGHNVGMLAPEDRPDEIPDIFRALREGRPVPAFETERVTKDGRLVDVALAISPVHDTDGRLIGASAVARDITDRKRAQDRFRQALESAPNAMVMVDQKGSIVLVNDEAERLFGYGREELLLMSVDDLLPERYRAAHPGHRASFFGEPAKRPMGGGRDLHALHRDGTEFPVEIGLNPIETDEGQMVMTAIIDITERKKAEAELERSNEELEHFAYVASHDLQEPLRMVASFTSLLADRYRGKLDAEADEYIEFVVDGARRLQGMIRDLLDYSRVGRGDRTTEQLDVGDELESIIEEFRATMDETGAKVTYHGLPKLMTHRVEFREVLRNLIGNALKYRSDRAPEVHVSAARQDGEWIFSVRDNGIGFDTRFGDRIFQMFQRLHTRDEYPGSGIGLAMCKRIIEAHGGRMWAESELGEGSTFSFSVPGQAG